MPRSLHNASWYSQLTHADCRTIASLARKLYDGPGRPVVRVSEKIDLVTGETFYNINEADSSRYDHHDKADLADLAREAERGPFVLNIKPGFVFDLCVYEPEACGYGGEFWGHLSARWTGKQWVVTDPCARKPQVAGGAA